MGGAGRFRAEVGEAPRPPPPFGRGGGDARFGVGSDPHRPVVHKTAHAGTPERAKGGAGGAPPLCADPSRCHRCDTGWVSPSPKVPIVTPSVPTLPAREQLRPHRYHSPGERTCPTVGRFPVTQVQGDATRSRANRPSVGGAHLRALSVDPIHSSVSVRAPRWPDPRSCHAPGSGASPRRVASRAAGGGGVWWRGRGRGAQGCGMGARVPAPRARRCPGAAPALVCTGVGSALPRGSTWSG